MQRLLIPALLLLAIGLAAACGGGDSNGGSGTNGDAGASPSPSTEMAAVVVTRDLVVGRNRFGLGIIDADRDLVLGADVHLRFFKAEGEQADVEIGESDARYESVTSSIVHEHPGEGTPELELGEEVGAYLTEFDFDSAGFWAVEATGTHQGRDLGALRAAFEVLADSPAPFVGEQAPPSRQATLADVPDITQIDTSPEPDPEMHNMTIADAAASGRPTVIAFATPAFCQSRICGPVKTDVVDPMFDEFGDRVNFVHVEPYDLGQAREGRLVAVPAMAEWGLRNEPWVFVLDSQGRVAARFEGLLTADELRPAIEATLG